MQDAERSCLRLDRKLRTITESMKKQVCESAQQAYKQIFVIWLGIFPLPLFEKERYNCCIMSFFFTNVRGFNLILNQELR